MDKEIQVWLYDILNSILEIESFVDCANQQISELACFITDRYLQIQNGMVLEEATFLI